MTVGQDVMKVSHDIVQRQMGRLIGDRFRKAYDNSLMLDEEASTKRIGWNLCGFPGKGLDGRVSNEPLAFDAVNIR